MWGIGRIAVLLLSLIIFAVNPSVASSPSTQENNEFIIVSGHTLLANTLHSPKIGSLGSFYYEDDIYSLLAQYDWNADLMYKIAFCESSLNARAVGDRYTAYHSYGILQIRDLPNRNHTIEELFDVERNIEIAYEIYLKAGRNYLPWYNCYRKVR